MPRDKKCDCGADKFPGAKFCMACLQEASRRPRVSTGLPNTTMPGMRTGKIVIGKSRRLVSLVVAYLYWILDVTASMEEIIEQVRRNINHAVEKMEESAINCQQGLMFVRDIPFNGISEGLKDKGWVSLSEFKRLVQSERCIANHTHDESQGNALALAACALREKSPDRSHPKFICLVTNSDCHIPLENDMGLEQLIYGLKNERIRVFIIGPENSDNYRQICSATGGMLFDVDALEPAHYVHILKIIGQSITGSMTGSIRRRH